MLIPQLIPVHDSDVPLFVQVRDQLRAAILDGRIAPGQRLPSESAMVAKFGVSRITIRQALAELQTADLVSTVNGKGSYVTRPRQAVAQGPMVGILETMRNLGYRAHGKVLSHRIVPASEVIAKALQVDLKTPVGAITLLRYRDDVPFVVGTTYADPELSDQLAAQDLAETDVATALEVNLGMRINDVQVTITSMAAPATIARRLKCPSGAPIMHIKTISRDYDKRPVVFSLTDCRGDMMDYRFTLRRSVARP